MSGTQVKIEGIEELNKTLEQLGARMERKITRQALSKASTDFVRVARSNAKKILADAMKKGYRRKKGEHLYKTLTKRVKTYAKNGVVFCAAGPAGSGRAPHKHLVEFGHRIVTGGTAERQGNLFRKSTLAAISKRTKIRGGGKVHDKMVEPRPYIKPAWDATKHGMLRKIISEFQAKVEAVAAEVARGNGVKQ